MQGSPRSSRSGTEGRWCQRRLVRRNLRCIVWLATLERRLVGREVPYPTVATRRSLLDRNERVANAHRRADETT
jgi:hypothetical protein